jgi:hypothetical protein
VAAQPHFEAAEGKIIRGGHCEEPKGDKAISG